MMLYSSAAAPVTTSPISCSSSFSLRYFSVSCAASCISLRCFFLLLFISRDAAWLITQLVHSLPPFEASFILILELPVLSCQTCSCKQCQVLSYCIPYLSAAHTWSQGFLLLLLFVLTLPFSGERVSPLAIWIVCWERCDYIFRWYRKNRLQSLLGIFRFAT